MADWRGVLQRHPERARQTVLRPLLGELRIMTEPRVTAEGRFYAFSAPLAFGALVTGLDRGRRRACNAVAAGYIASIARPDAAQPQRVIRTPTS